MGAGRGTSRCHPPGERRRCQADAFGKERGGFPEALPITPQLLDTYKDLGQDISPPCQLGGAIHGSHTGPCRHPHATPAPSFPCLATAGGSWAPVHTAPWALSLQRCRSPSFSHRIFLLLLLLTHFIFSAPPSAGSWLDIYTFITDGLGFRNEPRCSQKECINNYIAQRDNYFQSTLKKGFSLSSSD